MDKELIETGRNGSVPTLTSGFLADLGPARDMRWKKFCLPQMWSEWRSSATLISYTPQSQLKSQGRNLHYIK